MGDESTTEVLKLDLDTSSFEAKLDGLIAKGQRAGKALNDAFNPQAPSRAEDHIEGLGHKLAEFGKRLGASFGEGGKLFSEFAEKIIGIGPKMTAGFSGVAQAFEKAGGGMNGFMQAASAIGATLPGIAMGAGAVTVAIAGLGLATAGEGSHLEDLRQSVEGTEGDFAKLELMAHTAGLSIDEMTEANNRLREGLRQGAMELQNTGEMLQVMNDRIRESGEQAEIMRAKREAHGDVVKLAAVQDREEQLAEERAATMQERMQARTDRMMRQIRENMSGIARVFGGAEAIGDPEKMIKLGEAMEKIMRPTGGMEDMQHAWQAIGQRIIEVGRQGPAALQNLERGLNQAFGPHTARLIMEHAEALVSVGEKSEEAVDKINVSMGRLSSEERKALDGLKQDMTRATELILDQVAKIGAAIAKYPEAFRLLGAVISATIGIAGKILEGFLATLNGIALMLETIASEALKAAAAVLKFVGAAEAAERLRKAGEDITPKKPEEEHKEKEKEKETSAPGAEPSRVKDGFGGGGGGGDDTHERATRERIAHERAEIEKEIERAEKDRIAAEKKAAEDTENAAHRVIEAQHSYEEATRRVEEAVHASEESFRRLAEAQADFDFAVRRSAEDFHDRMEDIQDRIQDLNDRLAAGKITPQEYTKEMAHLQREQQRAQQDRAEQLRHQADQEHQLEEQKRKAQDEATHGIDEARRSQAEAARGVDEAQRAIVDLQERQADAAERAADALEKLRYRLEHLGESSGRASGGYISGPGSGTSDSILARVSNGEYVVRSSAVSQWGRSFMDAVNRGPGFSLGGFIDAFSLSLPRFAGGGTVSVGPAAALHPVTINLPGGHSFSGFSGTPSAVEQISRHAVLAQASSTMRSKPSWVR